MCKLLNSKHQLRASKTKVMKLLQRLIPLELKDELGVVSKEEST